MCELLASLNYFQQSKARGSKTSLSNILVRINIIIISRSSCLRIFALVKFINAAEYFITTENAIAFATELFVGYEWV
jgi:hypothetical protein